MTQVIENDKIEDGDIFRWRFRDEKLDQDYLSYWAKSCIAIAANGKLRDTFWTSSSGGISWTYEEARDKLRLEYLGNLAELESKPEYMAEYYDDANCVNINHSNSSKGNFYVRKSVERSKPKMLAIAAYKMETAERKVESAQRDVKRYSQIMQEIEAGKNLNEIWL